MAVNKVIFGDTPIMDISDSTVDADSLLSGRKAYGANGEPIRGTLVVPKVLNDLSDVVITNPIIDQGLTFDGTNWVNYGAKIILTYDDEFKGQTITCTQGPAIITKIAPSDRNSVTLYVPSIGDWIVSSEYEGDTFYSDPNPVNIIALGTAVMAHISAITIPEGATVLPTDDIQTWLACANITDKSYTTLAEILADRETFETLIADSNACDYMARSTSWAGSSEGLVPTMTGATTPSGEASASNTYSSGYPWKAFDGTNVGGVDGWVANFTSEYIPAWICYKFDTAVCANRVYFENRNYSGDDNVRIKTYKVQASNDDFVSDIHDLTDLITRDNSKNVPKGSDNITFNNNNAYTSYRLYITERFAGQGSHVGCAILQFYEADICNNQDAMSLIGKYDYCSNALLSNATWADAIANSDYFEEVLNVKVPKMTSDTTPSGIVSAYANYNTTGVPYKAVDGVATTSEFDAWVGKGGSSASDRWWQYEFDSPKIINRMFISGRKYTGDANGQITSFVLKGSNDGTNWTNLTGTIDRSSIGRGVRTYHNINNIIAYKYYRVGDISDSIPGIGELQFYGRASSNVSNTNGIIHTANGDTVTCNGNTYVADTNGIIDIDFSDFDEGTYTFTSSIAKNPDNLSQDYTKQFRITKSPYGGTTELYLMPDAVKTLYWWGYESDNLEDCTSANGWSTSGRTMIAPTHNTNDITMNSTSAVNYACGIGSKNKVTGNTNCIAEGITASSGVYWYYRHGSVKVYSSMTTDESITTNAKQKVSKNVEDSYITVNTLSQNGNAKLYAFWYE